MTDGPGEQLRTDRIGERIAAFGAFLRQARTDGNKTGADLIAWEGNPGGSASKFYDGERGRSMASTAVVATYVGALDRPDIEEEHQRALDEISALESAEPSLAVDRANAIINALLFADQPELDYSAADHARTQSVGLLDTTGTVIRGRDRIACAMVELLGRASDLGPAKVEPIQIIASGATPSTRGVSRELRRAIPQQIGRLADQGFTIRHTISADMARQVVSLDALSRFIRLVEASGDYRISARRTSARDPATDIISVPGVGSLISYQLDPTDIFPSVAIYHSAEDEPEVCDVLHRRAVSIGALADPMFRVLDPSTHPGVGDARLVVDREIALLEASQGRRVLLKNGLSDLTIPIKITLDRNKQDTEEGDEFWVAESLELKVRRFQALLDRIDHAQAIDVVTSTALERYLHSGQLHEQVPGDRSLRPMTRQQRRLHAQHLVDLVNARDNYRLYLIDDSDSPLARADKTSGLLLIGEGRNLTLFYQSTKRSDGKLQTLAVESDDGRFSEAIEPLITELMGYLRGPAGLFDGALPMLQAFIEAQLDE